MRTKRPRRHLLPALALIVIAGLAAGCSSGDARGDAGPQATVATAPSTTTTTAPADPYAVPDDASKIDADYVNRVLAALNHVYGDIIRKQVAQGQLAPGDLLTLQAIYADSELQDQAGVLLRGTPPQDVLNPPGDRRMVVDHILTVRLDCISAAVVYDFSSVRANPPPPKIEWIALMRHTSQGSGALNPTPWWFTYDRSIAADKCVA